MKKLTEEQRLRLKSALEAKSVECARLVKRLNSAEGLGSLPASEKAGEYAGCVLVALLLEISHDIDAGYLPKLDEYVSDYTKAANEARTEATRGFFRHKAAAVYTARRTLAVLLCVTEEAPKAPTVEDLKKKALDNLVGVDKETAAYLTKKDLKAAAYHTFLGTCLEEAYTSIGLITPEDAFLARFRTVPDVQE